MSAGRFETPEDFEVEELPAYAPSGEGGHTFLWVEKRLRNTEEVARWLAREASVRAGDVGYAGRKDRFAVTRQHFSVPDLDPARAAALEMEGVTVLAATRHPHKLRTAQLRGNRFRLRVHGVPPDALARVPEVAARVDRQGLPNRFGEQRFGRGGGNLDEARKLLAGERVKGDRRAHRFLVSALQAAAFNAVLAARELPIDRVAVGDLARRTDSGGLFPVEDEGAENERAARFEISATGPLFGRRMERPTGAVRAWEDGVLRDFGVDPDALPTLPGVRVRGGRRPVRVPVAALEAAAPAPGEPLVLAFELPAGSYATVLLEELLGGVPERVSSPS